MYLLLVLLVLVVRPAGLTMFEYYLGKYINILIKF